jgi:hypothetical protein
MCRVSGVIQGLQQNQGVVEASVNIWDNVSVQKPNDRRTPDAMNRISNCIKEREPVFKGRFDTYP